MQGGEPRVPRAFGLVALVESPPPPSNLQRSASGWGLLYNLLLVQFCYFPAQQISLEHIVKGCVRRNVKMIALTSALKWFTILKET